MSQQPPADHRPADRPGPAGGSGIPGVLKTAVPLAVLGAVVFGVAYMVQDAPQDAVTTKKQDVAFTFFADQRRFGPSPKDPGGAVPAPNLSFRGFYEPDEPAEATFWFETTSPAPVVLQPVGVNCSACSAASFVMIPPEATRNLQQTLAAASLPAGPAGGLNLTALVDPAARLFKSTGTGRAYHKFETLDWAFTAPAAPPNPDGWSPQWGIVTLHFTAGAKTSLEAKFAIRAEGAKDGVEQKLLIEFQAVTPFDVIPATIKLPPLTATAEPYTAVVHLISATRAYPGPDDGGRPLAEPSCAVYVPGGQWDTEKFVTVGKAERLTPAELVALAGNAPGPLKAAYRIPVTIKPVVDGRGLDIGPFERTVHVTTAGGQKEVRLTGEVRGDVRLSHDRGVEDLGRFNRADGATTRFQVLTERPEVAVELLPEECVIKKGAADTRLNVRLEPPAAPGGPYWVQVTVPKDSVDGEFSTGQVVLRVKGGRVEQRFRVPLRGNAVNR